MPLALKMSLKKARGMKYPKTKGINR